MKIANNKNNSIIEADEITDIIKDECNYSPKYRIVFHYQHTTYYSVWKFESENERDNVFDNIKLVLSVIEINDKDFTI